MSPCDDNFAFDEADTLDEAIEVLLATLPEGVTWREWSNTHIYRPTPDGWRWMKRLSESELRKLSHIDCPF